MKDDPPGTERFWDGEEWGPNPRYKRGAEPSRPTAADEAEFPAAATGEPGSVWARISARSADILLLLIPWYFLVIQGISSETIPGVDPGTTQTVTTTNVAYLWAAAALVYLYEAGFTAAWGATPGKRLVGLMIADRDQGQSPPGLARSLMRATPVLLVVAVLLIPILWLACVALMAIDRRNRSVFDFSGATVVVTNPNRPGLFNRLAARGRPGNSD